MSIRRSTGFLAFQGTGALLPRALKGVTHVPGLLRHPCTRSAPAQRCEPNLFFSPCGLGDLAVQSQGAAPIVVWVDGHASRRIASQPSASRTAPVRGRKWRISPWDALGRTRDPNLFTFVTAMPSAAFRKTNRGVFFQRPACEIALAIAAIVVHTMVGDEVSAGALWQRTTRRVCHSAGAHRSSAQTKRSLHVESKP